MWGICKLLICSVVAGLIGFASAMAQNLEVKRYNPSEWTKSLSGNIKRDCRAFGA
jgi:hypothetical protein